ncbi:MAG: GFA family protein [Gammaproteobacteria bacterium]
MMASDPKQGSCLCGAVSFTLTGDLVHSDACHCVQCRKASGHYFASASVVRDGLKVTGEEHLRWYASSAKVRRGFCGRCGSPLFWDPIGRDWTGVALGAIDGPTGIRLEKHIFVSEKGDYYDIADGLPQNLR